MKKLYSFHWDCGRSGEVTGVFVAEETEVAAAIGKDIYFGEILGKHSEVYGKLEAGEVTVKSEDQDFIAKCAEIFGDGTISGYNPLDYISGEELCE